MREIAMHRIAFAGTALTRALLGAIAAFAITTSAFASDTFDRTLQVTAQPDLYVSTGAGNIRIHAGSGSEIHVVGHVHAGWSATGDIQHRVQQIVDNPPILQSGNAVHMGGTENRGLFNDISIDYEITAPASVALNLHSGSGDVEVDNVGRFLAASSGSGSVRAHGLNGPADLQSGSGDIELEENAAGDVKAKTGSGSIRVHGFNGALTAHTGSGDVEADGHLAGPGSVVAGSGSLRLHFTPDARFNLEASTGSGDIRVHFPGAPQQDDNTRHHMTAAINGGGPTLEARTGSGDIEITNGH
jgi:hypothetical protein